MRFLNRPLALLATCLLILVSSCAYDRSSSSSAAASSGQRPRTVASAPNQATVVVVKSQKANIRESPSRAGRMIAQVEKNQRLTVTRAAPMGPWYGVRDEGTRSEGWIHGSTIAFVSGSVARSSTFPEVTNAPQPDKVPRTTGRSYVNVDGVRVPSPVFSDSRPAGATARCRDGSYSFSQHRRGTCSHHGGVAVWY
jgi:Protein of unknown function (DUF3761)/Bacterial SH3 domain